jgi:hypothetical protein
MITDDQLDSLPEDDLEAFVAFDALLREELRKNANSGDWNAERDYSIYMLAFTEARGIDLDVDDEIPEPDGELKVFFDRLMSRVNVTLAKTRFELAKRRKTNGTTFRIGTSFKTQLGGHLTAIRTIVQAADLPEKT